MCTVGVPPGAGLGNTTLRGKSDEGRHPILSNKLGQVGAKVDRKVAFHIEIGLHGFMLITRSTLLSVKMRTQCNITF